MSELIINDKHTIKGAFSFNVIIDEESKPPMLSINGILETNEVISDLDSLECDRYKLIGVRVVGESYGSEDKSIQYRFKAKDYKIYDVDNED